MHVPSSRQHSPLPAILAQLQDLYTQEYPHGAPQLYERLLPQLPDYISAIVRRKLELLIQKSTSDRKKRLDDLTKNERMAVSMFLDQQVLRAHMDVGRDAVLSNAFHTISHYETQQMVVANDFVRAVEQEKPEILARRGAIFFDVDGTKTIVDCTSHAHAGRYLEELAKFLCVRTPALQDWLKERSLRADSFSVAGDEFVMLLESEEEAIEKETLDAFAKRVQEEIAHDRILTSFISFDDPEFVMEYDDWSDEDRARYTEDPDSMRERFQASRDMLPERFIPSISFGSATLLKGLEEALSPDTEKSSTLEELGVNAFRLMVERADMRMKEDKRAFRESMTDTKWKNFLLRNAENRRLQQEVDRLHAELCMMLECIKTRDDEKNRAAELMRNLEEENKRLREHELTFTRRVAELEREVAEKELKIISLEKENAQKQSLLDHYQAQFARMQEVSDEQAA